MIKLKSILTAVVALLVTIACNVNKTTKSDNKPNRGVMTDSSKTLIVYFSKRGLNYKQGVLDKGNTEVVAGYYMA